MPVAAADNMLTDPDFSLTMPGCYHSMMLPTESDGGQEVQEDIIRAGGVLDGWNNGRP